LLKNIPNSAGIELTYNRLPKHPLIDNGVAANYKNELLHLALFAVFVEGKTIRTQQAFEQSLRENKAGLLNIANEAAKLALDIMEQYAKIKTLLKPLNANDPLNKDINEQLSYLIYAGFIHNTPYDQLKAIPRYMKAILYRLDKLSSEPQKIAEINRYAVRFWQSIEKQLKKERVVPELEPFRWALEEFRVSLFAQQLKTAYPISVKRMDKMWDERG
jgi:ATP-dependent helicase HrpA